jgi:colanic acid biosynthesis glycosyl transferase WcaI
MVACQGRRDLGSNYSTGAQPGGPLSEFGMATSSAVSILLIGINYAPEITGIGPYTTGLADHFARQGHSVRVITGLPHYPQWRRGQVSSNGSSNPSVSRHWHFIPRKPTALGRVVYEASWLASGTRALVVSRPEVVIGVIPSLSGGVLAWLAGRKFGVPMGLIFQDLMGPAAAQSGYRGARRVAGLARRTEGFVARKADAVATISDGFRAYLEEAGVPANRIHRVRNWTRVGARGETSDETRARLGWAETDYVCLHAGNMGQKQGLDTVLDSARHIIDDNVRIVLAGDGNDRSRLVARVQAEGICKVSFISLQEPRKYEAMLRAADLLLLNQRGSVAEMSLPGKLASYFTAGRPVLASVANHSPSAAEVRAARAGVVVEPDDGRALAAGIMRFKSDPLLGTNMGRRGQLYAMRWLTSTAALRNYDQFLQTLLRRDKSYAA